MQTPFKQLIVATFNNDDRAALDGLRALRVLSRERILRLIYATAIRRSRNNQVTIRRAGSPVANLQPVSRDLRNLIDLVEPGTSMMIAAVEHIWVAGVQKAAERSRTEALVSAYFTDRIKERLEKSPTQIIFSLFQDGRELLPPTADSEDTAQQELGSKMIVLTQEGILIRKTLIGLSGVAERQIEITEAGFLCQDTPVEWQHGLRKKQLSVQELQEQASRIVQEISDDPEGRYRLSAHFYSLFGRGSGTAGYGNSEIAFMRWEIERGVLNPLDHPTQPGSLWWRHVNGHFIYHTQLAMLIEASDLQDADVSPSVGYWLDFFRKPSAAGWYRAHNRCIVEGYVLYADLARDEDPYEQAFMNQVLYRVIYASAMVSGRTFLGPLGQISSHPALPAVDLIVKVPHFYPKQYPMQLIDQLRVLHYNRSIRSVAARILDHFFVLPGLDKLYQWQSEWLETPELVSFADQGQPCYPYSSADASASAGDTVPTPSATS